MSEDIRSMPKHERMKIPRQEMPAQDPQARARNYDEVALGYPEESAATQRNRLCWRLCAVCSAKGPSA